MLNIVNLPALINLNPKIELFDKQTNETLMFIDYSELGLLKSVYKKFNHPIKFKETFWLSDKQFKELAKIGYDEKLLDIGLKINYNETEIVLYNNILRLINQNYPIVLFEELIGDQMINKAILEKVKEKLEGKGYKIFQTRSIESKIEIGNATANLILEFLTGHMIKNDKFVLSDVSQFNNIFYYDNNADRILYLRKINQILDLKLQTTKIEIASNIKDFINNSTLMLSLNAISSNEVNPISTINIRIAANARYVKNFENYFASLDGKIDSV